MSKRKSSKHSKVSKKKKTKKSKKKVYNLLQIQCSCSNNNCKGIYNFIYNDELLQLKKKDKLKQNINKIAMANLKQLCSIKKSKLRTSDIKLSDSLNAMTLFHLIGFECLPTEKRKFISERFQANEHIKKNIEFNFLNKEFKQTKEGINKFIKDIKILFTNECLWELEEEID